MDKRQDLIDAMNLIADYIGDNLPDGFSIVLEHNSEESTVILLMPSGSECENHPPGDDSVIVEMCDIAKRSVKHGE